MERINLFPLHHFVADLKPIFNKEVQETFWGYIFSRDDNHYCRKTNQGGGAVLLHVQSAVLYAFHGEYAPHTPQH